METIFKEEKIVVVLTTLAVFSLLVLAISPAVSAKTNDVGCVVSAGAAIGGYYAHDSFIMVSGGASFGLFGLGLLALSAFPPVGIFMAGLLL